MMWLYFIKADNLETQLRNSIAEKIDFQQRYECPNITKEFSCVVEANKVSVLYTSIPLSGARVIYRFKENNPGSIFTTPGCERLLYKWLCQTTPSTQILKENGQEIYFILVDGEYIIFSNTDKWLSPTLIENFSTPGARHLNALYPLYEAAIRRYIQDPDTYLTSNEFQATQLIP